MGQGSDSPEIEQQGQQQWEQNSGILAPNFPALTNKSLWAGNGTQESRLPFLCCLSLAPVLGHSY